MADTFISDDQFQPPPELAEAWSFIPEIVKLGTPILRQVAQPIARITPDIRALAERMTETMKKAHGLGLAAPQVGISVRLFVYDVGDGVKVVINPQLLELSGEQLGPEGCLSIPGLLGDVTRANELRLKAFDVRGRAFSHKVSELEARVIQHEYDHLDGVLFFDKAVPETLEWSWGSDDDEDDEDSKEESVSERRERRLKRRRKK